MLIAAAGFEADVGTLKKVIQWRNVNYTHSHKKPMGVSAAAQLVGNTLYYKRFFPYYSFTLVAGLDNDGRPQNLMALILLMRAFQKSRFESDQSASERFIYPDHLVFWNKHMKVA